MTKDIKYVLLSIAAFSIFWWGANNFQAALEDFLLARNLEENPLPFFVANINQEKTPNQQAVREILPQNCQILAESAISVEIDENGKERIVFEREKNQKMYTASLSKLMTAIVALEFNAPSNRLEISKAAVNQEEITGNLTVGEILKVEDLLAIMLIESSNDAAFALAEPMGIEGFTHLMNLKAEEIGLQNTYFYNPTGLDPDDETDKRSNYSSAYDLAKIEAYLLKEHPLILEMLSKKEYPLYFPNGRLHHVLKNTNELLGEFPNVIGGKTGWTDKAGGCLVLILKGEKPNTYIINVVLNSPDRFGDMRKLITCSKVQ